MPFVSDSSVLSHLPILALRDTVVFPAAVIPVHVARPSSIRLVSELLRSEKQVIGVVTQLSAANEAPDYDDLYSVGTLVRALKIIKLNEGNYSVVLQGVARFRLVEKVEHPDFLCAHVERVEEHGLRDEEINALTVNLREAAREIFDEQGYVDSEATHAIDVVQDPGSLADLVASHLNFATETKQQVLAAIDLRERLRVAMSAVLRYQEVSKVKKEISSIVQNEMSKSQREFLLRQQLRTIRKELGESDEIEDELDAFSENLARKDMPKEAAEMARKQISRMRSMASQSSEYQVARSYVEWLLDLPWSERVPERFDVPEVRCVLDEDHYGLEKVKRRILEYIAVRKLRADARGPLLCFAGPPGVGKTSLGRSISRATGRPFVRVSLGGVQDEAEIRGHRRTYVGALPGRIITALKNSGASNPVMLLDEVDKMASDGRGSPAHALLEVLDPEQNSAFTDHYIEVPVDLSNVLFIATANRKDTIPGPLLDRFEVVDLPGYTRDEKLAIARDFLLPKQLSEHGITPERFELLEEGLDYLVDHYTREAGVRGLERQLASMCRDLALNLASGEDLQVKADSKHVRKVLGPPRFEPPTAEHALAPGVATALSWTPAGGDLLLVEASRMPGQGAVHLTGQMGGVMKESVATAFTYIRARAQALGLPEDFLSKIDVHVHLPQGALPKDGASAGVAIYASLLSMLTEKELSAAVAMVGEITLRGSVLRVERVKEKCLAAHRAGLKRILLPRHNAPDLEEIPEHVRNALDIRLISKIEEVMPLLQL
ncbi:MAG: endopeptidase La [Myxococcales bacterium]|nr:MAG: endopeptidase La [Myxococcales bacterium]